MNQCIGIETELKFGFVCGEIQKIGGIIYPGGEKWFAVDFLWQLPDRVRRDNECGVCEG